MTASDLLARISAGTAPTILDVRSREEFTHGHVPGALHVPFWKVPSWTPLPISLDDPLVVGTAGTVRERGWPGAALRRRGFRHVE